MRAAAWIGPGELRVVDCEEPSPEPGQAVVEVAACGICGSDLHSFQHGLAARPGQVLGHEFSGRILSAPSVDGLAAGDRVAVRPLMPCGQCARCREGEPQLCEGPRKQDIGYGSPGAFAERVLVPRAVVDETVFHLPPSVDDSAGALVEPLAVALHAVGLADPQPDDVVLVLGTGMIGLAVTLFLRRAGVGALLAAEPSRRRRERAQEVGADQVLDPDREDVVGAVREITGPGAYGLGARADIVIECAGAEPAIATALKAVRQGGTLVLAGIYGKKVSAHLDRIVEKELRVRGTVGYSDEFAAVIELLADGIVETDLLVSHTYDLERISEAFETQTESRRSLKVQVRPG